MRRELFFVRGGRIDPGYSDKLWYAGQDGGYWSSRAGSNTDVAYDLLFDTSGVTPSYGNYRCVGFSLRCLIPTN